MTHKPSNRRIWSSDTDQLLFKDPSLKGIEYLNKCITLCMEKPNDYVSCLESARLYLSFILMEIGNPATAITLMNDLLSMPCIIKYENEAESQLSNQRRATARLYACEAMCLMGDFDSGLQYLSQGKDDAEIMSEIIHLTDQLVLQGESRANGESTTILHRNQMSLACAFALKGDTTRAVDIATDLLRNSSDSQVLSSAKTILLFCSSSNSSRDPKGLEQIQ